METFLKVTRAPTAKYNLAVSISLLASLLTACGGDSMSGVATNGFSKQQNNTAALSTKAGELKAQSQPMPLYEESTDSSALHILYSSTSQTVQPTQTTNSTPSQNNSHLQPTITLTSPTDVSVIEEGNSINISADATSTSSKIRKVEFYSNGTLLGVDSSSPYSHTWPNAQVGSHDIYAIVVTDNDLTVQSETHRVSVTEKAYGQMVVYPTTKDVETLHKSNAYSVRLIQNQTTQDSFVYQSVNTATPNWSGTLDYMQEANHWTTFSFDGKVTVEASRLDGKAITSCVIRPLSLGISPIIQGDTCSFDLNKQAKISVEIDHPSVVTQPINGIGTITKEIVKNPLFVFAEPLEENIPSSDNPNVIYFGPGIHEIGKGYQIPHNSEVYIAGGAYVIGTFSAPKNPTNVRIRGRGILSAKGLSESKSEHNSWGNHAISFINGNKGSGLEIEGITITDPLRSCILSYNRVDIRNVKLFSWQHRNDGITAGNNSLIENSFIKVQDDNIKLYYSNQTIRDLVIWQQTAGGVFKFAWNLKRIAQNNRVENIDIIHSDVFTDYTNAEGDRSDMHSTSAVFSSMGFQDGAAFQNNTFKSIRIEEKYLLRLMSLRMVSTHTSPTSTSTWGNPSPTAEKTIANIAIEDLSLADTPYKQSTLYGNNGGTISNIEFSNLRINNALINEQWQLTSKIDGTGLLIAGDVSGIAFKD